METIVQYNRKSVLTQNQNSTELILSHFNESIEDKAVPCFFWGKLKEPYLFARSLLTLSKIVSANFTPNGTTLRDPVVTAGGNKLRLEAFSSCCGVYGKIDVLPEALEGEFLQQGTTNVDFNTEMIAALSKIRKNENLFFSVGKKEVVLQSNSSKVVEKKVTLPLRWIKGMTTVQILSAEMTKQLTLDKMQIQLLFRAIPKGDVKDDYYLSFRGKRPVLSPIASPKALCIGGIQRFRLVETLLPLADSLTVYSIPSAAAVAFLFEMKSIRFTIMVSRSHWRGFSGEGAALANLVEDIPQSWIEKLDQYAEVNEEFTEKSPLINELPQQEFNNLCIRLSSMGLLGYDLHEKSYYYRKLPFDLNKIESLNPRYKAALKIIQKNAYEIIEISDERTEVQVKGSGVTQKVLLTNGEARCTCTWFATHAGERGECKHILVAKILKSSTDSEIKHLLEELEV